MSVAATSPYFPGAGARQRQLSSFGPISVFPSANLATMAPRRTNFETGKKSGEGHSLLPLKSFHSSAESLLYGGDASRPSVKESIVQIFLV